MKIQLVILNILGEKIPANSFNTFETNGFYTLSYYADSHWNSLGVINYFPKNNIADFFLRNPSLGIVFAKHFIDKLKSI